VVGSPLRLSKSAARYDHIPALGEDTEAVLKQAGYDDMAISKLRQEKVI